MKVNVLSSLGVPSHILSTGASARGPWGCPGKRRGASHPGQPSSPRITVSLLAQQFRLPLLALDLFPQAAPGPLLLPKPPWAGEPGHLGEASGKNTETMGTMK